MHLMIRDGKSPDSVSMRLGFGNGFGDKNGERVKRDLKVKRDLGPTDVHFAEGGINLIAQVRTSQKLLLRSYTNHSIITRQETRDN